MASFYINGDSMEEVNQLKNLLSALDTRLEAIRGYL
jgi:hypothetical protein